MAKMQTKKTTRKKTTTRQQQQLKIRRKDNKERSKEISNYKTIQF